MQEKLTGEIVSQWIHDAERDGTVVRNLNRLTPECWDRLLVEQSESIGMVLSWLVSNNTTLRSTQQNRDNLQQLCLEEWRSSLRTFKRIALQKKLILGRLSQVRSKALSVVEYIESLQGVLLELVESLENTCSRELPEYHDQDVVGDSNISFIEHQTPNFDNEKLNLQWERVKLAQMDQKTSHVQLLVAFISELSRNHSVATETQQSFSEQLENQVEMKKCCLPLLGTLQASLEEVTSEEQQLQQQLSKLVHDNQVAVKSLESQAAQLVDATAAVQRNTLPRFLSKVTSGIEAVEAHYSDANKLVDYIKDRRNDIVRCEEIQTLFQLSPSPPDSVASLELPETYVELQDPACNVELDAAALEQRVQRVKESLISESRRILEDTIRGDIPALREAVERYKGPLL